MLLRRIIREEAGITPSLQLRMRGGTLALRPGTRAWHRRPGPSRPSSHKVVMLRNRLRTLEQVNASDLPDMWSEAQGYVSGCYDR